MSDNLPPGVTVGMIPGNRPEDEAWERYTDEVYQRIRDAGVSQADADALFDNDHMVTLLGAAHSLAYEQGAAEERADREMVEILEAEERGDA